MGEREGTRPEGDPLSRSPVREGEAKGRAGMVLALLRSRGIVAGPRFGEELALAGDVPAEALTAAAITCTDEARFRRRFHEDADGNPLMPSAAAGTFDGHFTNGNVLGAFAARKQAD